MGGFRIPFVPREQYDYRPGSRIADLIMEQGRVRAEGAARSGDIWGSTLANLGQTIGGAIQAHGAQQGEKKRDLALSAVIEGWDGQDPKALLSGVTGVMGPIDGPKIASGVLSFYAMGDKDEKTELELFKTTAEAAARMPEKVLAKFWPMMQPKLAPRAERFLGIPAAQVPAEYSPEVGEFIRSLVPGQKVGTREIKVRNPDGSETVQIVEDTPGQKFESAAEPQKEYPVTTTGPGGGPVNRLASAEEMRAGVPGYRAPSQPSAPSFQSKEVLNDEGQAVMANFNARSGTYVDPSTGQTIRVPRPVPPASETKDALKFKQAGPILRSVEELSERINTLQGVVAKASGEAEKAKAQINLNDDVAEYQALIMGFTPLVARALGHTGVLTEQDVVSVRALFPKPGDSKSLRDRKVSRIKSIVGQLEAGAAPGGDGKTRRKYNPATGRIE